MTFENNLKLIENAYPDIYKAIQEYKEESNAVIDTAKNGEKIIKYVNDGNTVSLNSTYNPSKEAERFMEEYIKMPDEAVLTMFGMANGSFLQDFINKNKKNILCIVFEPSLDIFMQVIKNIDIAPIIEDGRVDFFICGVNEDRYDFILSKCIAVYNEKTNNHITLPKYEELFPDEFELYKRVNREQYDRLAANTNTANLIGKIDCRNGILNMTFLKGCRSGRDMLGIFPEDFPAVIVAAGPSLEKNVELLKTIKNRALIMVVDTAVKNVISHGIIPDMVVCIDAAKSLKHFDYEQLNRVPFVANMDTSNEVLSKVKPDNLIFNSSDSVVWDDLFNQAGSEIYVVDEGGSVATASIAAAITWGFKKIILIGNDLALTGGKIHAGEGQYTDVGWATTEVEGYDGEMVVTRKDYCIFIRWIEDMAFNYRDEIEIIDATEGGAKKKNTTVMTFKEAIDSYCKSEVDVDAVIGNVKRLFMGEDEHLITDAFSKMKNNLRNIRKMMSNGAADCRRGAALLKRGEFDLKELKKINSNIGKLDKTFLGCAEYSLIIKYIASEDIEMGADMYTEEADDISESIRMYDKSAKYYNSIAEGIPNIIEYIKCAEERLGEMS